MPSTRAARRIVMTLAIMAGVQDGIAQAARLVGVDEARDRIVEIDTATGSVDTVVAGDDVRADQIVWSPDESFAYLLAGQRDEVLVFDPAMERIIERIAVEAPTHVVFHPTEPRAYVQSCGVVVLDTNDHQIVDSFPAWQADYLVLSQSGRWLYGVSEDSSFWMRDLWLSVSYDISWWDIDPARGWEHIGGAAAAFSSDGLVLAVDQAVWTFDPESREARRFPYRGAGMAFAMAPQSDVAIVVSHSDLVRIDLTTGATEVRALEPPLWVAYYWNYGDQVSFSADGTTVLLFQGDRLVARDTATLDVVWESELLLSDHGLVTASGADVLLFPQPRNRWNEETALLVRDGTVTTELESARWSDAAWRSADQSFYAVGAEGLERIDPITAARERLLVDLRLGDIAIAGETAFSVTRSDGTVRSAGLDTGLPAVRIATIDPAHADGAPLAVDPAGERVYAVNETGLTTYDAATGEAVDHLSSDDVGLNRWGPFSSLAILEDGIAVLGHGYYGEEPAVAVVVDIAARQVVAEHRLADYGTDMWVVREPSGTVALVATAENTYGGESVQPVVARISREGLLQQWMGEPGDGVVVALAPGAVDGVAFVATANERTRRPHALLMVDVATGELMAEHRLSGQSNALISDGSTVYIAVDADPPLLLFDAVDGELLGGLPVDVRLTQLEIADGDAGVHANLSEVELPSPRPPPGMMIAASGEDGDITVWFDNERTTHFVSRRSYDERIAFGRGGVLYAGAQRYERGNFLVVLEPLGGVVTAEIALNRVPGNILPTPDGELVFVETRFDSGSGLSVIDAATNRLIHELRPHGDWREPAMTPDGAYIVARDGDALAVLDTRTAAVTHYPFEAPADAIAATAAGAHYLGEDGRLYRIDLQTGDASVAGEPLVFPVNWSKLAGGADKLVAHFDGTCAAELVSADALTGERRDTLSIGSAARFSTVSAAGDYALTGYSSQVDLWDLRDGSLVSRLVRPAGYDGGNLVWSIAIGCLENCPPLPPAPERVRWDLLPSATPTATLSPTATPTPEPDPPVRQPGAWLEVDTAVGVAGEVVDIAIHRNWKYNSDLDVTGFQLDLWLPDGVRPKEWRHGEPDCGYTGDRDSLGDPYSPYRGASVFLPEGCDPAADCRGIRVLAAAESRLESWPQLVCRARIDNDLAPGSYPMAVDNLYLATEPQSDRLQAVVGHIYVLTDRRAATPTPDPDLEYYGPTPAPIPKLLLQGRGVETTAGWTSDIEFKLSGGAFAPLRGDLRVVVAMGHPLHPAVSDSAASCRRNPELSNGGSFELWPEGCNTTGDCSAIAAWIKVDPGFVGFDSGDPPRWYHWPEAWLFRCDIAVDEDAEDGQYYIRLAEASFDGRPVSTQDVLVDAFVPWFTPTATATATPQPSPRLTPRPCAAEDGTSIICIDDLEADAGDPVDLTVHYRSGGLEQAGLQFEIGLGEALVPVIKGHGAISDNRGPCRVNPAIDKNGSAFAYYGEQILALILAFDNVDPLPDDVRLVTCTLDVVGDLAPGEYEIELLEPGGSDPDGNELPVATRNGYLRIRGEVTPSTTPTSAPATPAATRDPTSTPQANTRDIETASDNSGCQVVEPRINAWAVAILLLLPPALWPRRRSAQTEAMIGLITRCRCRGTRVRVLRSLVAHRESRTRRTWHDAPEAAARWRGGLRRVS